MDKEYLEDYEQREEAEFAEFTKGIKEEKFSLVRNKYSDNRRFIKLHEPVAMATSGSTQIPNLCTQIPFSGSVIVLLEPLPEESFEKIYFPVSDIPQIINFIKKTGRLQLALASEPTTYEGFDYLDPIFTGLKPPVLYSLPLSFYADEKEIRKAHESFLALAEIRYLDSLRRVGQRIHSRAFNALYAQSKIVYTTLKIGRYTITEQLENLLVDDPYSAYSFLNICQHFITGPIGDLRSDLVNYSMEMNREAQILPLVYQPHQVRFPCEIGKFLIKKLTYAPLGLDACEELIYHYDRYDLQKVQESLNEAIVANHPDIVTKNAVEFSEILDNVWNDKTIPNRIKNIEIGVPVSIAAIGGIVAGLPGLFAGGFLSELGFKVVEKATEKYAEKLFSAKGEDLTERLGKLRTKSYQANIYDFKKKYKK